MRRAASAGAFLTLEGIEGSGKSTQSARLCRALKERGYRILHTREPGGTHIAERLRALLLASSHERLAPETEAFLILAARRQHVAHVIAPALRQGTIVVCDRFVDSTMAYQGYGRGLDRTLLRVMNAWATEGLSPDLTLLLDLPVTVGLTRRQRDSGRTNRLDREAERFHRKVRAGFLALAKREPRRIRVVDATQTPNAIEAEVLAIVLKRLRRRRGTHTAR